MKNESSADRALRGLVAVVAIVVALLVGAGSVAGIILLVVGAIMAVTAVAGFCPLYRMLGISTEHKA
jgi:predicted RND superfamily exporter protein